MPRRKRNTHKKVARRRPHESPRSERGSRRDSPDGNDSPRFEYHIESQSKIAVYSLLWLLLAILIFLGLIGKAGNAGDLLIRGLRFLVGIGVYVLPLALIGVVLSNVNRIKALRNRDEDDEDESDEVRERRIHIVRIIAAIIFSLTVVGLLESLGASVGGGGKIGELVALGLVKAFDRVASVLILFIILLVTAIIAFRWFPRFPRLGKREEDVIEENVWVSGVEGLDHTTISHAAPSVHAEKISEEGRGDDVDIKNAIAVGQKKRSSDAEGIVMDATDHRIPTTYNRPPLSLLSKSKGKPGIDDIQENASKIVQTLKNFGISVTMDEISVGPTVTRFAMRPAEGTKLSKVRGLESELALALAAHPLRIEAPIPGKSLIGVEIPNKSKTIVGLASMLEEPEFQQGNNILGVSLGKGVSGKPYFADITDMPHILIAGATGAGKSVTVHNMILSLLYDHGPEEVRFIMVDPKRVELTLYDKIPHLLTPVIKEPKKAILALKWATQEMDRRYDVLENFKVRDIASYHDTIVKPKYQDLEDGEYRDDLPERLPYIVIVIDELADLMQLYPRELESAIVRLAQMSRAVGIHLVLSTQRPSVNVITGLIKANIPARLAMRVSSQIDSRTILDHAGAELLLGKGDMLYKGANTTKPERVQCAYVDEKQVKKVVQHIIKHNREEIFDEIELPERIDSAGSIAGGSFEDEDSDDLYEDARELVVKSGTASTSYIQRKLRVGYSRAARLMDLLEDNGVIGPPNGSKPRDVLVNAGTETDDISMGTPSFEDEDDDEPIPHTVLNEGNFDDEDQR